jgi:DNA-binding NarL/FixJ family response regulator
MDAVTPFSYEILLVDDHPLVRLGVKHILEENSELKVVGELRNGLELLEFLKFSLPRLIILDVSMPHMGGLEATRMIKASHPEIKILILTLHNRPEYLDQARLAGADGYLLKEEVDKELLSAISSIRQGRTYLSPLMTA